MPGKIIITEDLKAERELEGLLEEAKRLQWAKEGRCTTCGCNLKFNIDRGILICAWSHKEQLDKYLKEKQ